MINDMVIEIAKIQGSLFEYSCQKKNCASSFFVKQFLYSSVSERMNNLNFVYSTYSVSELYEQLNSEKKLNVGKEIYPEPVMYWMGYLLAIMSLTKNISPRQIYKLITPKELFVAYEAYHSMDIIDAIERILESRSFNKDDFELFKSTR